MSILNINRVDWTRPLSVVFDWYRYNIESKYQIIFFNKSMKIAKCLGNSSLDVGLKQNQQNCIRYNLTLFSMYKTLKCAQNAAPVIEVDKI